MKNITEMATQSAAKILTAARETATRIKQLPDSERPTSLRTAYITQFEVEKLLTSGVGSKRVGYKIACTSEYAQSLLKLSSPFFGTLLSSKVAHSPAKLKSNDFFMRVIEPEFGFILDRNIPCDRVYSTDEVREFVRFVVPSIEVVDSRFEDWTTVGAESLIADHACHGYWVYGQPVQIDDLESLSDTPVTLFVNGKIEKHGSGSVVLGGPLKALTWLVNELANRNISLRAGEFVTTGITTEVYMAESGDLLLADFADVGTVELSFV